MKSPYPARSYLFLIFGGLAAVIAVTFAASWLFDFRAYPKAGAYAGGISFFVFLFVVMLYSAIHFLKKEESPLPQAGRILLPELQNVGRVFEKLSLEPRKARSPEEFLRSLRNRKILAFAMSFAMAMGLTFAGVWFAVTEKPGLLWLALGLLPFLMIALMVFAGVELKRSRDQIALLGLHTFLCKAEAGPDAWPPFEVHLAFRGLRQGREVKIYFGAGQSFVEIERATVDFFVAGLPGDPGPGLPSEARNFLNSLPALSRWESTELQGGGRGIGLLAPNTTSWTWLYDLWLAEQLVATLNRWEDKK